LADCSTTGGWHRCYMRTDRTVPRETARFKVPVLFFVCFANRNSCITQRITFRPVFLHNLMTSDCSRLHVFILSGSAVAVVALRPLHATTCRWTWRSHRRQGIPLLDEPLSASQECVLQLCFCTGLSQCLCVSRMVAPGTWLHTTETPNVGSNSRVNTLSWYNKPIWSAAWSVTRCNMYRRLRKLHRC